MLASSVQAVVACNTTAPRVYTLVLFMIKSCTCICKGRQDKVRHSPKADSEKNTELPRTEFEPVTTGLL